MALYEQVTLGDVKVVGSLTNAAGASLLVANTLATDKVFVGVGNEATAKTVAEMLAVGLVTIKVVKAAANVASVGGGVSHDYVVSGMVATDVVAVTLRVKGASPQTIVTAVPGTDKLTVTFSADPSTDHRFDYIATRVIT